MNETDANITEEEVAGSEGIVNQMYLGKKK